MEKLKEHREYTKRYIRRILCVHVFIGALLILTLIPLEYYIAWLPEDELTKFWQDAYFFVETEYFILLIVFSIALVRIYNIIKASNVGKVDLKVLFLHLAFLIFLMISASVSMIRQIENRHDTEYQTWLSNLYIDIHMIN